MRNYIIKEKTRHLNEKSPLFNGIMLVRKSLPMQSKMYIVLLSAVHLYGGREIPDPAVAWQLFNKFKCVAYSIRMQLDFGVKCADAVCIPLAQRWAQYEKFDHLWHEFESNKKYLRNTIVNPLQKGCLIMFENMMHYDKSRYDAERKKLNESYQNIRSLRR